MSDGKARHMFPGGNTAKGFFSYYSFILPQDEAKRIFILKGGPGVGKSSFMKHIAMQMSKKGFDVEYMHCSSDPDSLDGVVFPEIKVALLDGTAPHIIDPKNPGCVDEIVNLGQFWNEDGLSRNKTEILRINQEIGRTFARAYKYLEAAYSIYKDTETIFDLAMDHAKANRTISDIIRRLFDGREVSEKEGKQRHLFASAITPKGLVNFLPSLMTTRELIVITGNPGTGTQRLLERVRLAATERGLYTESYYCALNPYKLEHLIIPELDIAMTTSNSIHNIDREPTLEIHFDEYLDPSVLKNYQEEIRFNDNEFEKLLDRAVETIKRAKVYHDVLESYYIPNMNFEQVEECREAILERLLQF